MQDDTTETNWWEKEKVSSLELSAPLSILPTVSVEHAIDIMSKEGYDQLPVIQHTGEIIHIYALEICQIYNINPNLNGLLYILLFDFSLSSEW